jgi:phosphatidate cytidylyltransferase
VSDVTAPPVAERWAEGLRPRVLSALVLMAVALLALEGGPVSFDIITAIGAAVLAWEWTRLCGGGRFGWTGAVQAAAVVAVIAAACLISPLAGVGLIVAGVIADYIIARVSRRDHPRWIALGIVYIGLPCIALVCLRAGGTAGKGLMWWLLLSVWATDTGAYFVGRAIGGPKLAPRISPKKTWSGLIGGMASAAVIGAIVGLIQDGGAPPVVALALGSALLAVVAQGGDLAKSVVKRRFGVKDASRLIPGHGGLLDRVDGVMSAAIVLALWQWSTGGAILAWK